MSTVIKKYLSPEQLAEMLGISKLTVYTWTSTRQIPFIKIGKLVRFDPETVNNWLKQRAMPCHKDFT